MIKFKNGSTIQTIKKSNDNIRSKRAELVSFYCPWCNCIHVDYPIKNIVVLHHEPHCKEILAEK